MPTVFGHFIAGTPGILLGTWWAIKIWERKMKSMISRNTFVCTASFNSEFSKFPVEGIAKTFFAFLGLFEQFLTGWLGNKYLTVTNIYHTTMYFFYEINGVCDILTFYKYRLIPKDTDYFTMMLAMIVEAYLFAFYLPRRNELDIRAHNVLVLVIIAMLICVVIEVIYRNCELAMIMRAVCMIVHGSWFYFISLILYDFPQVMPPWAVTEDNIALATALLMWHFAMAFAFVIFIGVYKYFKYRTQVIYYCVPEG